MMDDTNEKYFAEYNNLQYVKHEVLKSYLGAWFPILASWHSHVVYIESHAGRGRYQSGQAGSPIVALNALLGHRSRDKMLRSTQFSFWFFELDSDNFECLTREIPSPNQLPQNVTIRCIQDDYETRLWEIVDLLKRQNRGAAPFIFVDPYSFKLSMRLLNALLSLPQCELFVNFMYRYVDMAMRNPRQTNNMNALFGTTAWKVCAEIDDPPERAQRTMSLFAAQLDAKYVTNMYMYGKSNALKYVLLHAANHQRGKEAMKDAMWKVVPDGTFRAFERDSPYQMVLIEPKPDLRPLEHLLWRDFAGQQVELDKLYHWLADTLYRKTHLHQVLTRCHGQGTVLFDGNHERVPFSRKPLISFVAQ